MTTIDSTTDLLPLYRATRERGEVVEIEIWAGVEEPVREQLLADCEGRNEAADTYLFAGQDADGEDVTWTVQVVDVFGTAR